MSRNKVKFLISLDYELKKRLKIFAIEHDTTITRLIEYAIERLLNEGGKNEKEKK